MVGSCGIDWGHRALIVGVAFYVAFPQLRYVKRSCELPKTSSVLPELVKNDANLQVKSTVTPNNCSVLIKTMTHDEQKVLNVLINHQGKYLQKYVAKEAGLSRLKTHRIIPALLSAG